MALEGTIKEFGIADILQLMAQQQKTGILIVENAGDSVEFSFCSGAVTATHSARQETLMGEMLIKAGLVSAEHLKAAVAKQKETFDSFGQVLVREGYLNKEQLEKVVLAQVYEVFCEVLQWREGTYRFVAQSVRDESAGVRLPGLESILLDVLRMIDEWPDVQKVIRSPDMVFTIPEGRTAEELDEEELTVYRLIDGKTPVCDIIAASLMGRFAACKVLCDLVQDGFIELAAHQPRAVRKNARPASDRLVAAASYACLGLALAAVVLMPNNLPHSLLPFLSPQAVRDTLPQRWFQRMHALRLETVVEVYYLGRGAYPEGIEALVRSGFLSKISAGALARRGISYTPTATGYTISAGGF